MTDLLDWFDRKARPFFERHAPDKIASLENDYLRLQKLLQAPDHVTVCFLGNSGIGKSTLLNALVAGSEHILPAGGIGPLTAQATEVKFSETPRFRVNYHLRKHLWNVAFSVESEHSRVLGKAAPERLGTPVGDASADGDDLGSLLDEEDREDVLSRLHDGGENGSEARGERSEHVDQLIKQAKLIVTGNQFSNVSLPYLADALRKACELKPRWQQQIAEPDLQRIERVKQVLALSKEFRAYERIQAGDRNEFMADLRDHAAGFLAPMIERIEVGWPSSVLVSGVSLVDLPGVGIAQDVYRDITRSYVREKARAIILVVDRAGPTEATVDVLRSSGYWDRLVGAADDPSSDPCSLIIAVTRVDDVAQSAWQDWDPVNGSRPKKREVFQQTVAEFKPRMKAQITEQLGRIGDSSNEAVQTAREAAKATILEGLEIHPVSAPELSKILRDEEDDPPTMLKEAEETGVPALQRSIVALGESERARRATQIEEVTRRLKSTVRHELQIIENQWRSENRAAEEAQKLEEALQTIIKPKREEYDRRVGGFREYLESTVPAKIEALVLEAKEVAEIEVRTYLQSLRNAHWATLRAAVRRGGTFYGSRAINLPDDISNYFQEPMAAVWGQKLLRDVRKRTGELAAEIQQIVAEICEWAKENGGASVDKRLLQTQEERIASLADQMKQVGKEAVDELRNVVKARLSKAIRTPIESACKQFVAEGNDIGSGVKLRILELFSKLAEKATKAAQGPAEKILQENFQVVRDEIQKAFGQHGDPIDGTANLIVERHEARVKRSDAQKKKIVLDDVRSVIETFPVEASVRAGILEVDTQDMQ